MHYRNRSTNTGGSQFMNMWKELKKEEDSQTPTSTIKENIDQVKEILSLREKPYTWDCLV